MNRGTVIIKGLKVTTRIGVPDAERAETQELSIDLEMTPRRKFSAMGDSIDATIDYHAVAREIEALAARGERRLIETLADEVASLVLDGHGAAEVVVAIRKFILPQTDWVGVTLHRASED